MCGRFTITKTKRDELTDRFGALIDDAMQSSLGRYNVAPAQEVVTVGAAEEAGREAKLRRWGLVPKWAKEANVGYKMINARSETVRERPAYRGLIGKHHHRCLVLADGYYEWLRDEARKVPPQPFHYTVDGGAPFAFAGLCTTARVEGEEIHSCTLLTCDANELAARIHDRMPAILADPRAEAAWLDPGLDADDAVELLRPFDSGRMSFAPANPKVNKVGKGIEGPELLSPPEESAG